MILCLPDLITEDERRQILELIAEVEFDDGARTVGTALASIKNNREITALNPSMERIKRLVHQALARHEVLQSAARPRTMAAVMINRYGPGMFYGAHVDAPIIGFPAQVRSDLSFTLFLADPSAYDGGELVFEQGSGEQAFKLPARSVICYPTGQLHRVNMVTRGERLAVVGWLQSLVRDPLLRELLYDVATARRLVRERLGPGPALDVLDRAQSGLLRRYAET
ncbi:MAG: Fe2+-dependent dioxygenase [Ahniella sp.]|nr:Fe2+-dependent dioxygenase [Ahniella sp.]